MTPPFELGSHEIRLEVLLLCAWYWDGGGAGVGVGSASRVAGRHPAAEFPKKKSWSFGVLIWFRFGILNDLI